MRYEETFKFILSNLLVQSADISAFTLMPSEPR